MTYIIIPVTGYTVTTSGGTLVYIFYMETYAAIITATSRGSHRHRYHRRICTYGGKESIIKMII